jgi:hypothetical protein
MPIQGKTVAELALTKMATAMKKAGRNCRAEKRLCLSVPTGI